MEQNFDVQKEYGIVLEGGGAKGAYQIGVWKALAECNIKIRGIAGVSVGALNGALMCMGDIEVAEDIWKHISYSQVMDVDDKDMDHLMKHDLKNIKIKQLTMKSAKTVGSGGIDIAPLRHLLKKYVSKKKIEASAIELIMGTLSVSDRKELEIEALGLSDDQLQDYLIASASLPVFKQEKIQGKTYLDGGMINNVPIDMLLKRGYKDIIVVRIYGIGIAKRVKIPDDVNLIQISPRVELGNILEFDHRKTSRNLKIGYYDTMRVIKNLQGKIYYISDVASQEEHCQLFMQMQPALIMEWIKYFKGDDSEQPSYLRMMYEIVLPKIAEKLSLEKEWTYTQLYLSLLELAAKTLKVKKYTIYTEKTLKEQIIQKYRDLDSDSHFEDLFLDLVIRVVVNENEENDEKLLKSFEQNPMIHDK